MRRDHPRMVPLGMVPLGTLTCLGLLAGCGYGASKLAHQAQYSMIGMSENDLQACAGPPDKITKLNADAQLFTYEYKPAGTGGFTLDLPLNLGGFNLGGSGTYCRADLRLVDHKVSELHYTGDNDKLVGNDGVCTPLIRGCMRQPEPTMGPIEHGGAFASPPVPPQSATSETP